jgi:hypothetical protein
MTDASDRIPWDIDARLGDPLADLALKLAQWQGRDDAKAQPHVLRAAAEAMDGMDTMLRELHLMRARLVTEIRAADAEAIARVDALLADREAEREDGSDEH